MKQYMVEKMLAQSGKYILAYKKGYLFLKQSISKNNIQKLKIHHGIRVNSLIERLFRFEPRAAVPLNDNCFIFSDHGAIYEYSVENNSITLRHSFSKGMNNPLSFCIRKNLNGDFIELVYGEYIWNENKGPVSIYKYDLKEWKEVYSFPANTVLHIHNIIFDEINYRYIILTGDSDNESAIWESDIDFNNVRKIVGGAQKYRACIAYPTEMGIYYATDTPLEQNFLYLLSNNGLLKEIYPMPGPCIYGRIYKDSLYMATSVEGDPTLGGWKYRLSSKLGKGVKDRKVHIIKCDKYGNVSEVANLKKDNLPMWLFQFGNAQFPIADDGIYISTQSTVEKGTYKLYEESK